MVNNIEYTGNWYTRSRLFGRFVIMVEVITTTSDYPDHTKHRGNPHYIKADHNDVNCLKLILDQKLLTYEGILKSTASNK